MDEYIRYGDLISLNTDEESYVCSKGFIDTSVLSLHTNQEFLQSVFRVFPQTIHSIQSELISTVGSGSQETCRDVVTRLKESAEGEIKTNAQIYTNFKQQPIRFGSLIQLQHVASGKFLALIPSENAEHDKECLKIGLNDFFSDFTLFRILPVFKFQKEGASLLRANDVAYLEINIPQINKLAYLHISEITDTKTFEINCSLDSKSKVRACSFTSIQETDLLLSGEFVWLIHVEMNTAIIKQGNMLICSEVENDSNGIWKIEGQDLRSAEVIKTSSPYRIRHMISGMYLSVKTEFKKGKSKAKLSLSNKTNAYSLWKFSHVYRKKKSLERNDLCMIVNCETGGVLNCMIGKEIPVIKNTEIETAYFKLFKCEENIIKQTLFITNCKLPLIAFDSLMDDAYGAVDKPKEFLKICSNVKYCLDQIDLFCKNKLAGMIDFQKQLGQILYQRQRIFKEQQFIELLSSILKKVNAELIFSKCNDPGFTSILSKKILDTTIKIYSILIVICKKNQPNQNFAYEFIDTYKHHITHFQISTTFIFTIVEGNAPLLYSLSKPPSSLIQHYTWLLRIHSASRKPHLLRFLQSICRYKIGSIKLTQEKIHEQLFGNPETFTKAVITTMSQGKSLSIILPSNVGEYPVLLDDCFLNGNVNEAYTVQINYFSRMIELFSDMCRDRNYTCKASIKDWFPMNVLIHYIWNKELTNDIRASFVRLLLSMYVDSHPRHEKKLPEAVKVLNFEDNEEPTVKYRNLFAVLGFDTSVDAVRNQAYNYVNFQKIRDSQMVGQVIFAQDDLILFKLKEDLIGFFEEIQETQNFEVLTYELIVLAGHLVRFGVIGSVKSISDMNLAILNPHDPRFSYEELDLTKTLKAMLSLLIGSSKAIGAKKATKATTKPSTNSFENTQVADKFDSSPMGSILRSFRNLVKSSIEQIEPDIGFTDKCKIEICRILEYILNCRVDFLINNLISWFNRGPFSSADFPKLFPPLVSKITNAQSTFQLFQQPEIKDLSFYGSKIIPKLIESFVESKDYTLQSLILTILFKSYSMRSKMTKLIHRIQVVTSFENSEVYIWVQEKVQIIKQLTEQSEIWLNYWSQVKHLAEVNVEKIELLQKTMQDIIESLDASSKVKEGVFTRGFSGIVDRTRQNTYFNLYIHEYLIQLVQDSMQTVAGLFGDGKTSAQKEAKGRFIRLFTVCHSLISTLAKNNPKIQECFHKSLSIFLSYIHLPLGQIGLICSIFRNNLKICRLVNEELLRNFTGLIHKFGRQVKFLEIFDVVQQVGEVCIAENQRLTVKVLLEGDYQHVCYMASGKKNVFIMEVNKLSQDLIEGYIDEPYYYHAKLLEVLAKSAYGSSGVYLTEMRCQKLITLDYVFELFDKKKDNMMMFVFIPVLSFFFHAYIDTEKTSENIVNNPNLIKFIQTQAEELRAISEITPADITEIEVMAEIIFKFSGFTSIGDIFDNSSEAITNYLTAVVGKFEWFEEHKIKSEAVDKIEILANRYNIELPMILLNAFKTSNFERATSANVIKSSWSEFKSHFLECQELKLLLKEEKQEFLQVILKINEFELSITTSQLIVAFLDFIKQFTFHKPKVSILNKVLSTLVHFLKLIETSIPELASSIKTLLNEQGIVRTIMALLCDPNTTQSTFVYLLELSNRLLLDGNLTFQTAFFQYFTLNASSQMLFQKVNTCLLNHLSANRQKWEKSKLIFKKKHTVCKTILRFLQLLCENHNPKLQNYLRDQFKSQQTFNLVLALVFFLEELMKKGLIYDFLTISQCFDTLTEMIQGPCKENQIAIIDSKFVEVASRLLSFDEKSDNMIKYQILKEQMLSSAGSRDEYGFDCLKGWMLSHLKYKCMITLLSLLEGQTDNYVITRMIRSLNFEILKENLMSVYFSYTEMYPPGFYDISLFSHNEDNEKYHPSTSKSYEERPEYYEFIIEVGFMVYHLMCHFKDNDDPENKRILKHKLPDQMLDEEKKSFFGTKLIGDLGKIGLSLLKTGFGALNNIIGKGKSRTHISETEKAKIFTSAYEFFQLHSGNIEIIFQDNIFRVYFWLRPEGHFITEDQKEHFHFYVERSSAKAKVQYLLLKADNMIEEMEHEFKLSKIFNKYKLLAIVASNVSVWKDLAFVMTLALNFMIISSFYNQNSQNPAFLYRSGNKNVTASLINVFGSIQMACSCCIVAFFLIKNAPVLIARGWRTHNWSDPSSNILIRMFQKSKNGLLTLYFAFSNVDVVYQMGFLCFSVLGTAVNPLFFAFNLLDILYRYPALQTVIKSVTIPRKNLILSFILILVMLYLYSIWAYLSFSDYFCPENQGKKICTQRICDNLLMCLKSTFDGGLKYGGGIGDYLNNLVNLRAYNDAQRLIFDTLFFIMIIAIMLSVIQGIIVDTFAYLRGLNDMNTLDRENKCFICSLDKEFIEYYTERSFRYHTTYEHNEFNYVLFISYLKAKDPNEHTGMESYLNELIEQKDTSWIPQQRAMSIKQRAEKEQKEIVKEQLETVQRIYNTLEKEIKDTKRSFAEYLESKHIIR